MDSIINDIKKDFPTFEYFKQKKIPLHYLDNAATTFKPQSVINKINEYYIQYPSNIHRGTYSISQRASHEYEIARTKLSQFLNAPSSKNIIFTGGTTASSNLFSLSFAKKHLQKGDEIILSIMEHHSNLLNWIELSNLIGFTIKYIELNKHSLMLNLDQFKTLFSSRTKLVSMVHISNTLGVVNPIKDFIKIAHSYSVPICLDLAQSVSHTPIDLQKLDVDFAFFSGHKMFGPTGVGVFYYHPKWGDKLSPFLYGGGMIAYAEEMIFRDAPEKFEGGTPPIAQAIALGTSVDYILSIGFDTIKKIDHYLTLLLIEKLSSLSFLELFISPTHSLPIVSFNVEGVHSHDVASILEEENVAIRVGQHCTSPLMACLSLSSTIRASLSIYNTLEDIHALINALKKVKEIF